MWQHLLVLQRAGDSTPHMQRVVTYPFIEVGGRVSGWVWLWVGWWVEVKETFSLTWRDGRVLLFTLDLHAFSPCGEFFFFFIRYFVLFIILSCILTGFIFFCILSASLVWFILICFSVFVKVFCLISSHFHCFLFLVSCFLFYIFTLQSYFYVIFFHIFPLSFTYNNWSIFPSTFRLISSPYNTVLT